MRKKWSRALTEAVPTEVRRFVLRYVLPFSVSQRIQRYGKLQMTSQRGLYATQARQLEAKLWGGFSQQALLDLEALKTDPEASGREVFMAALALGRWYGSRGDFATAHQNAVLARLAHPASANNATQILLEVQSLSVLGQRERARLILRRACSQFPEDPNYQLCLANTYAAVTGALSDKDEVTRLGLINHLFQASNLATVEKLEPARPLVLDNLGAPAARAAIAVDQQPKVTVLIPAYAAQKTLHIALDSLLRQTWTNLEIIVVDDKSPDGTHETALEYAARDSRVVALQMKENGGSYAARNEGVRHATGDYITVHDADDWSHPQKIEVQATHLMQHAESPANVTDCARSYNHLYFAGGSRCSRHWIITNHSSLMLRREVLEQLGGWDEVRIAADNELIRRLEHGHVASHPKLLPGVPLSFVLDAPESLTRRGRTHVNTLIYGVRRNYHDAAKFWLATRSREFHQLPAPELGRAFPAPGFILKKRQEHCVDLLFIMDFDLDGGAYVSTMDYVRAAVRQGFRVAVFHWRRYDRDVRRPVHHEVRQLAQDGDIYIVSPGESITADTVVAGYPVILRHAIDLPPEVASKRFVIITNQTAERYRGGGDVQYDPEQVADTVHKLFGLRPSWIPISELMRDVMESDGRYRPIHSEIWPPLIDTAAWSKNAVEWRGEKRSRPRIGRHVLDHPAKWPESAENIRAAYCADRPCDVVLLGNADAAIERLGHKPRNWSIHDAGTVPVQTFLTGLDFFVHFPHEDYVEAFSRAVLEAMAVGLPVVLPPGFERTFGEAALYSRPEGVWPLVNELWSKENAWSERSKAAMRFARERCDWSQLTNRIEVLVGGD